MCIFRTWRTGCSSWTWELWRRTRCIYGLSRTWHIWRSCWWNCWHSAWHWSLSEHVDCVFPGGSYLVCDDWENRKSEVNWILTTLPKNIDMLTWHQYNSELNYDLSIICILFMSLSAGMVKLSEVSTGFPFHSFDKLSQSSWLIDFWFKCTQFYLRCFNMSVFRYN